MHRYRFTRASDQPGSGCLSFWSLFWLAAKAVEQSCDCNGLFDTSLLFRKL